MNSNFEFEKYLPISKVDEDERMVYGYASTPDLDSQGEIVDLNAIKQALPEYMKFPTIREMHTANAVGRTKGAKVDEKGLFIGAKVVDDNAWKKVKEGVFNGFSIGGRIKEMIENTITSLDLTEISLVDVPANKQAVITLFKSGKSQLQRDFEKSLVKFAFNWEGVNQLEKAKKKEELVEETIEEVEQPVVEEQVEVEQGSVETEEATVEETEEVELAEDLVVEDEVIAEAGDTIAVEVDEAKQVSDEPTDITKVDETLQRLEKMEEKYANKIEKLDSLEKMDKALSKLTSMIEKLDERLEKVENTPAEVKTKASFLVEKTLGSVEKKEENPELKEAKEEFAKLMTIRDTDPQRYALEKMSDRAFSLRDKIRDLSK